MDKVIDIVGIVRKLKSEKNLSLKVELEKLKICSSDKDLLSKLKTQENILAGVTKAKKIEYIEDGVKESNLKEDNGILFAEVVL
jgi:valyl-tRNA synthetase